MEEINLKELFDYFKSRIIVILIIVLAILIAGSVYSLFLKKPLYRSTATVVLVSEDGSKGNSYSQSDVTLNKSLVGTYSEIVKSRRVVDKTIKNLSLDYSIDELSKMITVSSVEDTEIIKISVSNPDKTLSADIANEIVKVFSEEVKTIYKLQNVAAIDIAEESASPYNINYLKDFLIYILAGIVLSAAIIFIIYYFDTTVKTPEEIENKLGLPVFGIVPKVKRKEK